MPQTLTARSEQEGKKKTTNGVFGVIGWQILFASFLTRPMNSASTTIQTTVLITTLAGSRL